MCSRPSQEAAKASTARRWVELGDGDVFVPRRLDDVGAHLLALLRVADGERHGRTGAGERAGGLDADPGTSSGDDRRATAQVDPGDDLRGRRAVVKLVGDAGHLDVGVVADGVGDGGERVVGFAKQACGLVGAVP